MRTSVAVAVLALTIVLAPAIAVCQTPQSYSLTLNMGNVTIQVARDGSKASVEQTVPPSKNGPGMHVRAIYDFSTHKVWTLNLEGGPCSVVTYTSPALPAMFDPISAAEEMRAGLAQHKPALLRSETVNGIATKVYEVPVPEVQGKMRMFLDEKLSFPVKLVLIPGKGKEHTQMEVTRLSLARPAADLFAQPQNCQVQAGETNASGGHVESEVGAAVQGEAKLAAVKPAAAKPAQEPAAAAPSKPSAPTAAAPEIQVLGAGVGPVYYTGPAPAAFTFSFSIEASGPVEAVWVLVSHGDTALESGTLVFNAAGTKELKVPVKIGTSNGTHWEGSGRLEVVVGEKRFSSATIKVSADCKAK